MLGMEWKARSKFDRRGILPSEIYTGIYIYHRFFSRCFECKLSVTGHAYREIGFAYRGMKLKRIKLFYILALFYERAITFLQMKYKKKRRLIAYWRILLRQL